MPTDNFDRLQESTASNSELPIKSPASLPDLQSDIEDAFNDEDEIKHKKSKKYIFRLCSNTECFNRFIIDVQIYRSEKSSKKKKKKVKEKKIKLTRLLKCAKCKKSFQKYEKLEAHMRLHFGLQVHKNNIFTTNFFY